MSAVTWNINSSVTCFIYAKIKRLQRRRHMEQDFKRIVQSQCANRQTTGRNVNKIIGYSNDYNHV